MLKIEAVGYKQGSKLFVHGAMLDERAKQEQTISLDEVKRQLGTSG
ncbi:MAG: hypothetical protein WD847_18200 [Pirellulales bacterium]